MTPASVPADVNPESVAVDPTGRYAYVANFNNGAAGSISQYAIGAGGALRRGWGSTAGLSTNEDRGRNDAS